MGRSPKRGEGLPPSRCQRHPHPAPRCRRHPHPVLPRCQRQGQRQGHPRAPRCRRQRHPAPRCRRLLHAGHRAHPQKQRRSTLARRCRCHRNLWIGGTEQRGLRGGALEALLLRRPRQRSPAVFTIATPLPTYVGIARRHEQQRPRTAPQPCTAKRSMVHVHRSHWLRRKPNPPHYSYLVFLSALCYFAGIFEVCVACIAKFSVHHGVQLIGSRPRCFVASLLRRPCNHIQRVPQIWESQVATPSSHRTCAFPKQV